MVGDIRFEASQELPDVPYAECAKLLGLDGIWITDPDDAAPAWTRALNADRPFVLEAMVDTNVPPLPPHITPDQAAAVTTALLKGDLYRMTSEEHLPGVIANPSSFDKAIHGTSDDDEDREAMYLRSTGQLHKGGPPAQRPLQVVNAPRQDAEIPGGDDSFGSCGRDRTDLRPAELVAGLAPTRSGLSSCGTATQRVREGSCCARFEAWFHGGPPGASRAPRSRRPAGVSRCAAATGWPAAGAAGSARAARSDRGSHVRRGRTRR
jgi:hypothetical protein